MSAAYWHSLVPIVTDFVGAVVSRSKISFSVKKLLAITSLENAALNKSLPDVALPFLVKGAEVGFFIEDAAPISVVLTGTDTPVDTLPKTNSCGVIVGAPAPCLQHV